MIRTETVVLRAWQDSDIPALQALRNDIVLQQALMSIPRPNSPGAVRDWLNRKTQSADSVFFVLADKDSDAVLGYAQLAKIDALHRHAALGICLSPAQHGAGVAAEACRGLFAYALHTLGLRKIVLEVLAGNGRAIRFYKKIGFAEVGRWKDHFLQDQHWHDVLLMEKLLVP
jgi:diamine N-acetyltransferase